jgi:hypothetical protein
MDVGWLYKRREAYENGEKKRRGRKTLKKAISKEGPKRSNHQGRHLYGPRAEGNQVDVHTE